MALVKLTGASFDALDSVRQMNIYWNMVGSKTRGTVLMSKDSAPRYDEAVNTPMDEGTRRFIQLDHTFVSQLDKQLENPESPFAGQKKYGLQEKMKLSAEILLRCCPDAISLDLTSEGSIFYSVKKGDIFIYLQHYLIDEFDDADEVIVSVFRNNERLLECGGTMTDTINQLSETLSKESIVLPVFA